MAGRVLLGGGSGFVGRHLQKLLRDNGYCVTLVSRKAGPDAITWKDVSRNGLPSDCTAVVNLAGENILNPLKRWNADYKEAIRSSRVGTTKTLASAISQAAIPPKVFAIVSGVAGYKPSPTTEYTELSALENFDFLSKLVIDWEAAAVLPESLGVRQAVVRSGVVLGRNGGMIQQLYYPFFAGLGGKVGSGSQWLPWIHIDDITGIFLHILKTDSANGIFNGVAPTPCTNEEFTKAFAGAMRRPAVIPVPAFAMNMVYGAERGKVILDGQKVKPVRTLASGYEYKYPNIEAACSQLVS